MRRSLLVTVLVILSCLAPCLSAEVRPLVYTDRIDGPIDPGTAVYFRRSIEVAERNGAQALVLLLETPGGLDDSMRSIVKDIVGSRVPVIVYVWPAGARAASAGAIITIAGHIAAMSPGTAMGAAHPVNIGGGQPSATMARKIENDAAAYVRSIAALRGRNVSLSERIVRRSVSVSDDEAKKQGLIDLIAPSQRSLLDQVDGRRVKVGDRTVTLRTRGAQIEQIPMSAREHFIHAVSDPNLIYILMLIAIYGIIFELSNPGAIFPGVIGGIALILTLMSLAVVPVNLAGVLFILLGVALLLTDLFVAGHGILTVGGLAAFVVGSLILFETGSPVFRVSVTLIITMTILTGAFFLFAVGAGIRAQRNRVVTGLQGMMGELAVARTDIDPTGKVFVEGELWNARTTGEPIRLGETVKVVGVERFTLWVQKEQQYVG